MDETCILEREIVDRIEKEMSRRSHFLESFSQKRDEIIEQTPTLQGRQKMIKCLLSSLKDLAALERDRTRERAMDVSFPPASSSFVLPKVGFSEESERSPARRRTSSSSSESDRISFFSFFFSLTARTVLTQFFSLSYQTCVI